jgi:hypothetical protein
MAYATRTPGKPYIQPLDAAQRLGEERKRWLLFRGLTEGKKAVSIQYPDNRCDYTDEVFQDHLERTGLSGQNYRIPVDVVETESDDEPLIEEKLYTTLVPVAPVRFLRTEKLGAAAFPVEQNRHLAPLREGWIYLFLDGHLWREIQVRVIEGGRPVFADVNLTRYQGSEERPATVEADTRVLLPYRVGDESKPNVLQICYAEQQWGWSYICRLGGMDPQDPRYIEALHTGKHYGRDYRGIKADAAYRRKRMQSVDLHKHWLAGGERGFLIWDSYMMDIDRAVEQEGQNQYRIDRRGEIPVLALHDPLGIARDLAAAHQVAWGGLRTLVKFASGELNDVEQGATREDFETEHEYKRHLKFVHEMRQRQASHQVALMANAYFLKGKPPSGEELTGEAAKAHEEAMEHYNYMRYNIDPAKIDKILLPEERAKQRELITQTKAALVEYLLAGEEEDDPAHFTTALAEQCTLEGDHIVLPYETLNALLPHLNDRPVDLDGLLDGEERKAEAGPYDPGMDFVLRLLGSHPTAKPLRLTGCLFPEQVGVESYSLYDYNTTPVPKGLPQFDPNLWFKIASVSKKAGAVLANFFEKLAKAEHQLKQLQTSASGSATAGGVAGKGTALMPLFRLAFVARVTSLAQIEISLSDYLTGRLPPGLALFRSEMMVKRLQEIDIKYTKLAAANSWRIPMDVLKGEWRQNNLWSRQGDALMDELRLFNGEWAERFSKHDPELARFLENEKIKVLVTYEDEVAELFDDASQHLTWHHKKVLTLTGFVAAGGSQAGNSQSTKAPRYQAPSQHQLPKVPKWYQKPGMTKAARYSILGFASTFELWNLGMAGEALKEKYKVKFSEDKVGFLISREMYDFIGALADTSALGLQWAQTVRVAAVGWDDIAIRRVAKKVKLYKLANAGSMPALSAAERSTFVTLQLVKWATGFSLAASVISFFDTSYDTYLALNNRDKPAALGAGIMSAGFAMAAIASGIALKGLIASGSAGAVAGPLGLVATGIILIGAGIYFSVKKDRLELWLHHSPIAWDNPDSGWDDPETNAGDHAYWNEKPGLMFAEFLDLMIQPQIRFTSADTGSGTDAEAKIEIHYPYFVPGVSETELEWGYVHENQLNSGERLSRAEPEDWNQALKNQLKGCVQLEEEGKPQRVLSQCLCLPVAVGRFRIAVRLRFYPYGRNKRVAGSEIVLPEPVRDEEGAPKSSDGGWLKAETEGHRSGNVLRFYGVGDYVEPFEDIQGA